MTTIKVGQEVTLKKFAYNDLHCCANSLVGKRVIVTNIGEDYFDFEYNGDTYGWPLDAADSAESRPATSTDRVIWKGQLARSGRTPKPFTAEILDVDGMPTIVERRGVEIKVVSPHEISGMSWLDALTALARKVSP